MEVSNHCLDVCQQCLDLEKHAFDMYGLSDNSITFKIIVCNDCIILLIE
jgi:hypothetical protein